MGNSCCKKKFKKKIVLLLVGLDNAGKTVAAKGLAGESLDDVLPTVGFSIINLTHHNYIIKIFDLGGGPNIRGIWNKYFVDAHGIIFVVDSSDLNRLDEAKQVLNELLSHKKICGKPLLLLSNKQDNENALDDIDLIEKLNLEELVNNNKCPTLVQNCSANDETSLTKLDPAIKKGYDWLLNYIIRNYNILNKRVEEDVIEQNTVEERLRQEKIENIRRMQTQRQETVVDENAIESYSDYKRKILENGFINNSSNNSIQSTYTPNEIILERPKTTAVQIVRKQLEMNDSFKKQSFISRASNKTSPLCLYGVNLPQFQRPPHSARENRRRLKESVDRRKLKSAGDRRIGENSSRNNYELFEFDSSENSKKLKLESLDKSLPNMVQEPFQSDISVINVD